MIADERDRLVIRSLKMAIATAIMIVFAIVGLVIVNVVRACPACAQCPTTAEKP